MLPTHLELVLFHTRIISNEVSYGIGNNPLKNHNLENFGSNFKPIFRGMGVIFFSLKRRVVHDLWPLMFVATHPPWTCSPLLDSSQHVIMQPAFALVVGCWLHPCVQASSTCVLVDKVEASKHKNYQVTVTYNIIVQNWQIHVCTSVYFLSK